MTDGWYRQDATPGDETAETMSFANFTDAVAVANKHQSAQHCVFTTETLLLMVNPLLKQCQYFTGI